MMDNDNVYLSAPPGYEEDPLIVYRLVKPLYGMPSAARGNMHGTLPCTLSFNVKGVKRLDLKKVRGKSQLMAIASSFAHTSTILS